MKYNDKKSYGCKWCKETPKKVKQFVERIATKKIRRIVKQKLRDLDLEDEIILVGRPRIC